MNSVGIADFFRSEGQVSLPVNASFRAAGLVNIGTSRFSDGAQLSGADAAAFQSAAQNCRVTFLY